MAKKEEVSKAELYRKERKERLAKEAKKNAKRNAKVAKIKRVALKVVAVVAAVAIVASATIAIVNYTGSQIFKSTVAKAGDVKISTSEFQYYYRTTYANLVSTAAQTDQQYGEGYYAQNQGFDYTALPSEQSFPNEMLPEDETKTYETWDDYLTDSTISSIQYLYALASEAEKANVTLTEDEEKAITDQIEEIRTTATENGASINAYLRMTYGSGVNENSMKTWMLRDALAQKYAEAKQKELYDSYKTEDVNAEYEKNKETYAYADFRLYVFNVDTSEIKDGTSESEAEKIKKSAQDKAKKEAEEFLKNIKTEADFVKAADELDKSNKKEEELSSMTSAEETTMFEKAQYKVLEEAFGEENAKWAFSSARKKGEKKVFAYSENGEITNYYAIFVLKPAYRDEAVGSDIKAYTFSYTSSNAATSKVDDATKKEIKAKAQSIVNHWNEHDGKTGTPESFAGMAAHMFPDDTSIVCSDYNDYTTGTLPEKVDKWAADKARKHGDVALIETDTACYVVYYDAKNEESNWQMAVRQSMSEEAYLSYEEGILEAEEYAIEKDGFIMKTALKLQKSKINREVKTYLYSVMQSMQSSNTMTY